ncbi:hypothetical protein AB0H71_13905 [Nocardia sp. NPDC050697]|uniref:hypothetical protein n=1 Tax=Nocardia sp. NPDC050697 TaxID=3155158 RepID=UPI0033C32E2C
MTSISSSLASAHPSDPTSLYLYYDRSGLLLYVGITKRGISRNYEHNQTKDWWPYVVRQEVFHHPTRANAQQMERALIKKHRPPFNKQHNPDHGALSAAYLRYVTATDGPRRNPGEVMRKNAGRLRFDIDSIEGKFMTCNSCAEDLSLAAAVNLEQVPLRFKRNGLAGDVVGWARREFGVEATLKGAWLSRVSEVSAIVIRNKKKAYVIDRFEFVLDGEAVVFGTVERGEA